MVSTTRPASAPTTGPTPAIAPAAATAEARRVFGAVRRALTQTGAAGVKARAALWAGEAAAAVEGDVRLKKVRPQAGADNPLLLPVSPTVLALSQARGRRGISYAE